MSPKVAGDGIPIMRWKKRGYLRTFQKSLGIQRPVRCETLGFRSQLNEYPFLAHPSLRFLGSALPFNLQGESLFNQSLRAMAEKSWIFKYGRVPITFVCQDYLADVTPLDLSGPYSR